MHFDDTTTSSQPGEDITLGSGDDATDLGPATYDSDHDGTADSVVVSDQQNIYVVTDVDHDGHADGYTEYDPEGNVIGHQGQTLDGQSGSTGQHPGADSGSASGNEAGSAAGQAGASSSADAGATAGAGTNAQTGTHGQAQSDSATHGQSGADTATQGEAAGTGEEIQVEYQGQTYDVGAANLDADGDGRPDTFVQHNNDGSYIGFTDRDGDGNADQVTEISATGQVTVMANDGTGHWDTVATGHIDPQTGEVVQDAAPQPGGQSDTGHHASTGHSDTTTGQHDAATGQHDASTGQHGTTSGGPGTTTDHQGSAAGAAGDISLTISGQTVDAGAPTVDLTGDGRPDTAVTETSDGTRVFITDVDGDGKADQITEISSSGQVVVGVADGQGQWEQVATGHITDDGHFVQDSGQGSAQDADASAGAASGSAAGVSGTHS